MPLGKNYFKTDPLDLKGKTPIGMAGFDNVRDTIDHQQNKILKEVIDDAITALGLPLSHINAAEITDVGTNTHAQIDTHIADTTDPHGTTLTQTNLTVSGAFTSQGIDDNANAVAITIDSSENVGIGTASPAAKLDVKEGDLGGTSGDALVISNQRGTTNTAGLNGVQLITRLLRTSDYVGGSGGITTALQLLRKTDATEQAYISLFGNNVGIRTESPTATLHVDQSSTTAAIPVLTLDQADVSEELIEFVTTIGTGNAIEAIGAKTLTTTHFIK